ncbi:MAG TPA: quinone oxidoreductase [Paenalcaligenes hominis]|uniref:Quinone oxidoreductase n=1 Tax=Paenalcaligenes hominis TaxID=643674 RepID=A0A9D2VHV9_9BURK|nr:quinone oxidoreductase [Paenalcaligenes hominis]
MSTSIKAIRIEKNGGPEVMQMVQLPVPQPQAHEVVVRNKAIGLNFIDIYCRDGLYPSTLPHGLGFEGAGVVEAVGAEVTHVKEGDRVAYGQGPLGAYAEAHCLPADRVVKLPDAISFEEGAAMMLKGLTVQYLFRQTYRLEPGQTILFHAAAGGVGLIACQWAKALGVNLIGTASNAEKMELAKQHGAWAMINYKTEDVVQRVLELTDGAKVPVVYDGVGAATWERSLDCLQPRGLMVSYGNASGPVTGVNLGILAQKGSLYVTRPILGNFVATQEAMQTAADELFDLVESGQIKIQIGQRVPLEQVGEAHKALAAGQTTGATILTLDN